MNQDFQTIYDILADLKADYASSCPTTDVVDSDAPVTERDIVAEIRNRLKPFCRDKRYYVHCEMRPAPNEKAEPMELKRLPRVDVVILADKKGFSWLAAAKILQDKYTKGYIEARFSSVPVKFFHTAIEVKIQSNVVDAKKDITTLRWINDINPSCNCYFVLLNARGRLIDHDRIVKYAGEKKVPVLEYTSRKSAQQWHQRDAKQRSASSSFEAL